MYDRLFFLRLITLCVNLPCLILLTYPLIVRPLIMEVPFLIIGVTLLVYNVLSFLGSCLKNYISKPQGVKAACRKALHQTLNSFSSAWMTLHLFTVTALPILLILTSSFLYANSSLDFILLLYFYMFSLILLLLGVGLIVTLLGRMQTNRERLDYDVLV